MRCLLAVGMALAAGCGGTTASAPAPVAAPATAPAPVPDPAPTPAPPAPAPPFDRSRANPLDGMRTRPAAAPDAPGPVAPAAVPVALEPPPPADWSTYRTTVQGGVVGQAAEVVVDLGAKALAPDPGRPQLLQITVQMLDPDDSGGVDRAADSQLAAIGAALRDELAPALQGRYVGRIRRDGSDEHFVYVPAAADADAAVAALEARFAAHTWLPFSQEDAAWTSYLDLLYPRPDEPRGG